jgi:hypothetical protein
MRDKEAYCLQIIRRIAFRPQRYRIPSKSGSSGPESRHYLRTHFSFYRAYSGCSLQSPRVRDRLWAASDLKHYAVTATARI